jgi:hypothetical protein
MPTEGDTIDTATQEGTALPKPYMSWSQVSKWRTCGEQYRLSYIEKVARMPSGAAIAGSAVHRTVEDIEEFDWWRDPVQFDKAGSVHESFIHYLRFMLSEASAGNEHGWPVQWGGRKTKDYPDGENQQWWELYGGLSMLKKYGAVRRNDEADGLMLVESSVERRVSVHLDLPGRDEPMLFEAYVDSALMQDTNTGFVVPRDVKSGSVLGLDPMQLALYGQLWMKMDPNVRVEQAEFAWLRAAKVEDVRRTVDLRPYYPLLPRFILEAEHGILHEQFTMRPSNLCGSCGVRHACEWGKVVAPVE